MKVTHMRSARTVTLIETVVCEGEGSYGDPVRLVTYYATLDGRPVATADALIRSPWGIGADGKFPEENKNAAPAHTVAIHAIKFAAERAEEHAVRFQRGDEFISFPVAYWRQLRNLIQLEAVTQERTGDPPSPGESGSR